MIEEIVKRVQDFLDEYSFRDAVFVVATSGGSDSVCLLHALSSIRNNNGFTLYAVHVNHMIRGEESDRDEASVHKLCRKLDIPCFVKKADVPKFREENNLSSLEEAARIVRYNYLHDIAEKHNAVVLTGHNKDDNVETVLMHIIRGCGINGLTGLSAVSDVQTQNGPVKVARPLLTTGKAETDAYCKEASLEPCFDSTNDSTEYTRNKIRREIIPLLETINPDVKTAVLRLAQIARDEQQYINQNSERIVEYLDVLEDSIVIMRRNFDMLHPYAKKELIRMAIKALTGNVQDIENKHIDDMIKLADGPSGKKLDLPNGLEWLVEYQRLVLRISNSTEEEENYFETQLLFPGETSFPQGRIHAEIADLDNCNLSKDPNKAYLDLELIQDLYIRPRQAGDVFIPFGSSKPKKVARFLMDEHVSKTERQNICVLCNNNDIVWLIGKRVNDNYKITNSTKLVLKLTYLPL